MSEHPIIQLVAIMAKLRDPETGCPWDIAQDFKSIAPYTIEEAYEVADAIRNNDFNELRNELGDLLLQVIYHSQMAQEAGLFTFEDIIREITEKMISRHPHVFGDHPGLADSPADVTVLWENKKEQERQTKNPHNEHVSVLDGVALALPALMRAQKLQRRAARIGFDWPSSKEVMDKIEEELSETKEALETGDEQHVREEFGDLLFAFVNLGRKLDIDVEDALRDTNEKFSRRFKGMECALNLKYEDLKTVSLEEMETLWIEEKHKERNKPD